MKKNITTSADAPLKPQMEKFSGYQKFLIAILAILQFTVVLDFMILSPLGNILIKEMSLSPEQFSWAVSAYGFAAGIAGFISAGFNDKFDRKKILLFFYTGFIIGTLLCGLATSFEYLLIARIITGIFGGVIGSVSLAIVTDIFHFNQRGRVMGFIQMAFAGSQVLGIPAGLAMANHFNWHSTFFMIVALGGLIGLVVLFRMKPVDGHLNAQTENNPIKHLFRTIEKRDYRIAFLASALLPTGGYMMMPFGTTYVEHNIGIASKDLPIIFLMTGIASMLIMPLVGRLSDRLNKFHVFVGGTFVAIIMVTIYTNLNPSPLWLVIMINVLMFVGIMGRIVPSNSLSTAVPDLKDRGAFMSVNSSLQYLMGGVSSKFAGLIVTQETPTSPLGNYDVLGLVVTVVSLICIFLVYRMSVIVREKTKTMNAQQVPAS